jgi:hypothetical protein
MLAAARAPNLDIHALLPAPTHDCTFIRDRNERAVSALHLIVAHFSFPAVWTADAGLADMFAVFMLRTVVEAVCEPALRR